MSNSEEPKIIVDEDWKSQVEKEKEQLRQAEADKPPEPNSDIPEASFQVLMATLGTQAMAMMGLLPNPDGSKPETHLGMARHLVDMMGVLEEKTKGNLTEEEAAALKENLHQLRMAYVAVSQQASVPAPNEPEATPKSSIELP